MTSSRLFIPAPITSPSSVLSTKPMLTLRSGKKIPLKKIADEALENVDCIESVIVAKRAEIEHDMKDGRDTYWEEEVNAEDISDDCPAECVDRTKSLLGPESIIFFKTPLKLSEKNFSSIPRVYIECLNDKALFPSVQKLMYTLLPCQKIISMETNHLPIFSAPNVLAEHLDNIAESHV